MIDQFDILVTENNDDVTVNVTNNLDEVVDIFIAEGGEEIELNITNNIVELNIIRGAINLSLTTNNNSGAATYDNITGVFNIPNYTLAGLGGQTALNGLGFVKISGTTISYDNSTYLTTINGIAAGGELTGTYPNPTLVNSAVTGKLLSGVNITGGTIQATDSILTAFGKVQNQINGLIGGTIFQGLWNASTNNPSLASGAGSNGHYYIVSVAGSTNLNGITDWNVGDWAIFSGTRWQKVDNTDAVVSVNGFTGAVSLTTSNITEGTNLYYTDARVNANANVAANTAARHASVTLGVANGLVLSGQQLSLLQASSIQTGALSSTDWTTFNNKQNALNGTGFVKINGTTISYDNNTYALDSDVVKLTGNQSISGIKTFTNRTDFSSSGIRIGAEGWIAPNQIYSEGTGRFFVNFSGAGNTIIGNSSANVGIGTINPNQKLHVVGDALFSNDLTISGGLLTNTITSNNINANLFIGTNSAMGTSIVFSTDFSERMRITNTGNVGIGTTNPQVKLDVEGSVYVRTGGILFVDSLRGYSSSVLSTTLTQLALSSNFGITGGNVGIGTTSPSANLHVANSTGNGVVRIDCSPGGTSEANLTFGAFGFSAVAGVKFEDANTLLRMYAGTSRSIAFNTNDTERMRITSGGNLLLGTTTDNGARLQVTGAATFSSSVNAASMSIVNSNPALSVTDGTNTSFFATASSGGAYGNGTTAGDAVVRGSGGISLVPAAGAFTALRIASTGAATFSSSVTATQFIANGNSAGGFEGLRIVNASTGAAQIVLNNSAQSWLLNTRTDNHFSIFNATASTTPFFINTNGNVGIGTTSPTARLHVNGIQEFATNALAIAAGLTAGAFYHTAGMLKVVI